MGRLPQTPRAQKVIEYAIDEARRLNHNYVGTEHLLLGLLREEEGVAAQVLMNLGLMLDGVRDETKRLLGCDLPQIEKLDNDPPVVSEPEPMLEPRTLIKKHLKRLRVQLQQAEDQKNSAVSDQDFERAARWRDITNVIRQLIAHYEGFQKHP